MVQPYLLKLKASKLTVVAVIQPCGAALSPQIEGRQAATDCCDPAKAVQPYLLKLKASKLPVVAVIQPCGTALSPQIEGRQAAPDCCCPAKWCSLISSNWRQASWHRLLWSSQVVQPYLLKLKAGKLPHIAVIQPSGAALPPQIEGKQAASGCCNPAMRYSLITSNWRQASCPRLLLSSQVVQPYLVKLKAGKLAQIAVIQPSGAALPPQIEGRQAATYCCDPAKWCSPTSSNWRQASCQWLL